tara:strand:+ start:262 stop:609 length:348 start_codon:yes stop_codon:yes gene_type:complete
MKNSNKNFAVADCGQLQLNDGFDDKGENEFFNVLDDSNNFLHLFVSAKNNQVRVVGSAGDFKKDLKFVRFFDSQSGRQNAGKFQCAASFRCSDKGLDDLRASVGGKDSVDFSVLK